MRHFENIGVKLAINKNEQILWVGKPNKKCFILESIFNPLLPFAIIWLLFDINFMTVFMKAGGVNTEIQNFIIVFLCLHLMPLWLYLGGVLLTFLRYKNTEFAITDKAIYVSGGSIFLNSQIERYENVKSAQIKRGIFDQQLGVGDVLITLNTTHTRHRSSKRNGFSSSYSYQVNDTIEIIDIYDYRDVVDIIYNQLKNHKEQEEQ